MAYSTTYLLSKYLLADLHLVSHVRLNPLTSTPLSEIRASLCTPKALTPNKKAFCPSLKVSNSIVTLSLFLEL